MTTTFRRRGTGSPMRRLAVVPLAAVAILLAMAGPASAAPVTVMTHEKDFVETFVGVINGCDEAGPLYTVTITGNQFEKERNDAEMAGVTRPFFSFPIEARQVNYSHD